MDIQKLLLAAAISGSLMGCGGSSGGDIGFPSLDALGDDVPAGDAGGDTGTDTGSGTGTDAGSGSDAGSDPVAFTCPDDGSLYFCDDFEDGTIDDKWELLINSYGLPDPGVFDVLEEASSKSLRFTAGTRGSNLNEGELILVKSDVFTDVPNDYFVEYRIRARNNSNTGNKYLFGIGRYAGPLEWYFGGFNMQSSIDKTQVEAGLAESDAISRLVQLKKPVELGEKDATDGTWYDLRYDMVGNTVTVYLDGEEIGSFTDENNLYTDAGRIGLFTYNRSFEVDYVKVGDPAIKPASLVLSETQTRFAAEAGDDPVVVSVTAKTGTGETDTFDVVSSDEAIVSVAINGTAATLTPVGEGSATITFTSGSNPNLKRLIEFEVAPQFIMSTATYNLTDLVVPAVSELEAYEDTALKLTFDSPPELGQAGSIRIFRSSDDTLVDKISLSGDSDAIGYGTLRELNTAPVRINGNTATISIHSGALALGTRYYVAISESTFPNAVLAGSPFQGLGKDAGWEFTTRDAGPATDSSTLTVDDDGKSADFRSVQSALNFVMHYVAADTAFTININDGVYEEPLYLRNKNNLTLLGQSRDGVIIQYPNNEALNSGTSSRGLFLVEGSDLLTLENLTLKNTSLIGEGGQAETIYFNSDNGRLIAKNAAFFSEQDTLLMKGWNWFYNTIVAGNVDFIWGYSKATLFENSEIRTLGDSRGNGNGGYLLQARTQSEASKGFVFLNSSLTRGDGPLGHSVADGVTYLARSAGQSGAYDNITFVNTRMDAHIRSVGWLDSPLPNPLTATAASGWREYNSMDLNGDPLDTSTRLANAYTLTQAEAEAGFCNRAQVFADYDSGAGWDPFPEDLSDDSCASVAANSDSWSGGGLLVGDATQSSATIASGSIDVQAADGTSMTITASDGKFETKAMSFYLASQDITGDFTLTAKVKSAGSSYAANQFPVGLMMCECDTGSSTTSPLVHVGMHMSGSDWVTQYGHVLADDGSWGKASGSAVTPGDNLYLKLERQGQAYYVHYSTDGGANYTQLGANTFTALPATVKVGVFAAPYNDGQSYTFEDIQLTQ